MEKKEFTVGGNKHLKQALINELLEVGYEPERNIVIDAILEQGYFILPSRTIGKIGTSWMELKTHYELPKDYEAAKQAFLDALQPKEVKTIFKGKEIILEPEYFNFNNYRLSVSEVKHLCELFPVNPNYLGIKVWFTINIGYNREFTNVTKEDLEGLLQYHAEKFPE